jgi:hypothetical protein
MATRLIPASVFTSSGRRVFDFMRASLADGARSINGAVKAQSPPRPQRTRYFRRKAWLPQNGASTASKETDGCILLPSGAKR